MNLNTIHLHTLEAVPVFDMKLWLHVMHSVVLIQICMNECLH